MLTLDAAIAIAIDATKAPPDQIAVPDAVIPRLGEGGRTARPHRPGTWPAPLTHRAARHPPAGVLTMSSSAP